MQIDIQPNERYTYIKKNLDAIEENQTVRLAKVKGQEMRYLLFKFPLEEGGEPTTCVFHPAIGIFKLAKDFFYRKFEVEEVPAKKVRIYALNFVVEDLEGYTQSHFLIKKSDLNEIKEGRYYDVLSNTTVKLTTYVRSHQFYDAVNLQRIHHNQQEHFITPIMVNGTLVTDAMAMLPEETLFFSRFFVI